MENFKYLPTGSMAEVSIIDKPDGENGLDLHSPALAMLTDFSATSPPMLESSTSIADAETLMIREHVGLKLVIDRQERFRGVITLLDLRSSRLMRVANSTGIARADLTVGDVMTPREELHSVDYSDFSRASVGRVLSTMKRLGDQHLLVVDQPGKRLRGIISARDIAAQLHFEDPVRDKANSFAEIYSALRH